MLDFVFVRALKFCTEGLLRETNNALYSVITLGLRECLGKQGHHRKNLRVKKDTYICSITTAFNCTSANRHIFKISYNQKVPNREELIA